MKLSQPVRTVSRWAARALGTFALWTLWLGLSLALAVQIKVAVTNQFRVPAVVLRAWEDRLRASGLEARFGKTMFDPSGRMLIENVSLALPDFEEPVLTARALFVRLDTWELAFGRVEPIEFRIIGANLHVPSMLSPSGRSEGVVRDLDASVRLSGDEALVDYAEFHLDNLPVAIHGAWRLGAVSAERPKALPVAALFASGYGTLSRRASALALRLRCLDEPTLEAVLAPADGPGARVDASLVARGLKLVRPFAVEARGLRLSLRATVSEAATQTPFSIEVAADNSGFGGRVTARHLLARLAGTLPSGGSRVEWTRAEASAGDCSAEGFELQSAIVSASPASGSRIDAEARVLAYGAPLGARGELDWRARNAEVRFDGGICAGILGPIGALVHRDLGRFADSAGPIRVDGEASFGDGFRFARAKAWVAAAAATAFHVRLDEARGTVEFDGRRLLVSDAFARIGEDFARGSYDLDLASRRYRFLLDGRLRPLDIAPWFPHQAWWREFFGNFAFPDSPPSASADVRGRTDNGRAAAVFVLADCPKPVARGVPIDRILARVFVRFQFDDGLEVLVDSGKGEARGTFTRRFDQDAHAELRRLDFNLVSTLDPALAARALGPVLGAAVTPFAFTQPPSISIRGSFENPGAPAVPHRTLDLDVRADAPFRFHDFPLDRAAFHAAVRDESIALDPLELGFAGGTADGHARVSSAGGDRKLSFDCSLAEASLGRAIAAFEDFSHRRTGKAPPAVNKFVADQASVRFDLNVAAAGSYSDLMSFRGKGESWLQGPELAQIRLLGGLSNIIQVTALRFTKADARFQIEGGKLVFSDIDVTGRNSEITANGTYSIDRHALDFYAKVHPFEKSTAITQQLLNVVFMPFSSVLETRLKGTIESPSWSLVLSVPNPLRPAGEATKQPPSPLRPGVAPGQNPPVPGG